MKRNEEAACGSVSMQPNHDSDKTTWERPQLVRMGHLKDFVQGGGKSGSSFDMDPQGGGKGGIG